MAVVEPPIGTGDALTHGVVHIGFECVIVEAPDGRTTLPVFIKGVAHWSAKRALISVEARSGSIQLHDGDQVTFGGEGGTFESLDGQWFWWVKRPAASCVADQWFLVDGASEPLN